MKNQIQSYKSIIFKILLSSTARNTYLVFFGNMTSAVFAFVFTVVLYRVISISDFGYYSALFSLFILVADIGDVGIGASLSRFLPPLKSKKYQFNRFIKTSFIYQIVVLGVFCILIYIFSDKVAEVFFHTLNLAPLVRAITIGIFGLGVTNYFGYILSAEERFVGASVISALSSILRLGFLILVIVLHVINLTTVIWTQIGSMLLTSIVAFCFIGGAFIRVRFSRKDLKELVHFSKYLGIARSLTALSSRLDALMLIAYTNSTQTGIYSTASRVISIYPLLAGSFTSVIAPKISGMSNPKEFKLYLRKVILATIALIATILILIVLAYPFITILFGEKARDSVEVFRVLLVSQIFFTASIPAVAVAIYYVRKPHILTLNSILQLIIVVVGNMIFIPRYGRIGPALSLIVAFAASLICTTYMSFMYLKKHHED
jgi:O-antigen/teichoic acid export membrane protein